MPEPASKMWIGWKNACRPVGVEQRQLLLAVHHVGGVVSVEHDRGRRAGIAAAEQVDEAGADPVQRGVGEVLQARDGGLARDAAAGLRRTLARDHQRGIVARRIEIVGILVASGDRHHARGHHRPIGMDDQERIAPVGKRVGDHPGEVETAGRLAQHHKPAVGQVAGVLRGCERLGPDG